MRKLLFFSILFFVSISVGTIANAVGGGGGGGSPSCTEDTWTCGEWGECSSEGKQTRTCTITFDCSNLDTPQPAREQTCTPPKAEPPPAPPPAPEPPSPAPEPTPAPQPAPASAPVAPAPQEASKPAPRCSADTWKCDEWSACDADGNQKKLCKKTVDCATADTPEPLFTQRCEELQCGNKTTIRERVSCRLNLTPAGLTRELEIEYLPEECRMYPAKSGERTACINLYKAYKPCWQVPVGPGRSVCARQILKVDNDTPAQLKNCSSDVRCVKNVKEKVYNAIKFRFYDLEERAEDLLEDGKVSKEAVVELTARVFENKQAFNVAKTKEERRGIILQMREAWQRFIGEIKR